jgi:hypothetical protein
VEETCSTHDLIRKPGSEHSGWSGVHFGLYSIYLFLCFLSPFQRFPGCNLTLIIPHIFPSVWYPTHCSLSFLQFNAMHSKPLTLSLNKPIGIVVPLHHMNGMGESRYSYTHYFTHDTRWNEWTASRFDSLASRERKATGTHRRTGWMRFRAG